MTVAFLMLAGAAGAIARYLADVAIQSRGDGEYPWGTFWVNVSGCLLLGLIWGWVDHHEGGGTFQTIAGTGFCGAYTTFSSFTFETVSLAQEGALGEAIRNAAGTLITCAAAAGLGMALAAL
jgi:fluoride exporter